MNRARNEEIDSHTPRENWIGSIDQYVPILTIQHEENKKGKRKEKEYIYKQRPPRVGGGGYLGF